MNSRRGVSNQVFAATVIVLVLIAAVGFTLYLIRPPMIETITETMTHSVTETMNESTSQSMSGLTALPFAPATGQMIHNAWLLVGTTESGQYALSIYAQGLDTSIGTGSDYIVEGVQSSGSMAVVPIGANATVSEFDVGSNGVGSYFTLLNQNPSTSFESIEIAYLPGMEMTNATVVATVSLSMLVH
jgi:hypothetical protein